MILIPQVKEDDAKNSGTP